MTERSGELRQPVDPQALQEGLVDRESYQKGYEPPGVNSKGLGLFAFFFVLTAIVLHTDLWVLLHYYISRPRAVDTPASIVPRVAAAPTPPLQPIPLHNRLPWEDMLRLRTHENAAFIQRGWKLNPVTGEAIIPPGAEAALESRRSAPASAGSPNPARFPPTMAPVRAGVDQLPRAKTFPPVNQTQITEDWLTQTGQRGTRWNTDPAVRLAKRMPQPAPQRRPAPTSK